MWLAVISGLVVSIDALFIGVSFGTQRRCRFWHLLLINAFLFILCVVGYGLGIWIGDSVDLELDLWIGLMFISLGAWTILYYYLFARKREKIVENESKSDENASKLTKTVVTTGLFMSLEAMLITIGLMLVLGSTTILIPLTVALAHFVYSATTFFLARYLRRLPQWTGHVVAGGALIIYGVMAIVI